MSENTNGTGKPAGSRTRTWRPGFVKGKPWDPANIGVVKGYPKTEEEWQARRERQIQHAKRLHARGGFTRAGVPDGWSGRKEELEEKRADAREKARQALAALLRRNEVPSDDERAHLALEYLMAVVLCDAETVENRAVAARIVLTFTKDRAPRRKEDALLKAEELIAELREV
ncbi:hypothetical protein M0638_07260 [Roseomonas sp. NAR14]|uniref:Uncharacterized protein n=1 Tax=Roseomonas acroporae TaxID=2937791 RepID=A0A9X1Y647_9PROT|nr:hypothetical protein [Roseomonas acroporae]MCK8784173.1 hypothetical protein [Roseomonas acroporae]